MTARPTKTPAEAAWRAAAEKGVHLTADQAEHIAAAVLGHHDDTASITIEVPPEAYQDSGHFAHAKRDMHHRLLSALFDSGKVPIAPPTLTAEMRPGTVFEVCDMVKVTMSVKVRDAPAGGEGT